MLGRLFLVLLLVALPTAFARGFLKYPLPSSILPEAVVQTAYGPVLGNVYDKYRLWEGVPFAAPPLGWLRWQNPTPPGLWTDVLDCTNFTIGCAQTAHSLDVPTNTSEDCLYLAIWAPRAGAYNTSAAVMIWFYGGAFKEGGESFALYDGAYLASTTNTIVIATNYRIDVLGWLYLSGLDFNVGLEDQRFALKWIQGSITAFGGNPNLVTIFGQSCGAQSVVIHLACPDAWSAGLFQRAIVESAPSLAYRIPETASQLAVEFAILLGCTPQDILCMINKTTDEVLAASRAITVPLDVGSAIEQWAPVVTGDASFPQQPNAAFDAGEVVKVPTMIGSNLGDGILFGWVLSPWNSTCHCNGPLGDLEYLAILYGVFAYATARQMVDIVKQYPPSPTDDNRYQLSQVITDFLFACYSRHLLRDLEAAGVNNTYLYQFTRLPPICVWPKGQTFCCNYTCHGDEIPYVFYDSGAGFPWTFEDGDASLAQSMSAYWASFAMYGDPNQYNSIGGGAQWPTYRTASDINMDLNWPLNTVTGLKSDVCAMFDQVGYYS